MIIGIPKEALSGENRVASAPTAVVSLLKLGFEVQIQKGCGTKASFTDQEFIDAGASVATKKTVWQSDIIFKVNPPTIEEIATMKMPDLTANDMDAAVRTIAGSARAAGIETEGVV